MTANNSAFVRADVELRVTNRVQLELMRGVLERDLSFRFEALGFSMMPFVQHGDILTVAPLAQRVLRAGDVIAFVQADTARLAVHRVIATRPDGVIVRGDNCPEADKSIPHANVLGVVTRVERDGRIVGLGLGAERRVIAWLNAREWLLPLKQIYFLPFRPASAILRRLQQLPRFRAWAKRFRPAVTIDEASPRDLIEVHARLSPGSDATPPRQMPGVTNFVARRGKQLFGFVQLVRHPKEHFPYVGVWLFSLVVWGRYRGMGLGEALTRRVIEQAQTEGARELRLLVYADNARAINLYRKLGFEFADAPEFARMLGDEVRQIGRRRVVMRCSLEEDQTKNA
jgi:ribosomal protein S18 acetylase RimI-like enzyme